MRRGGIGGVADVGGVGKGGGKIGGKEGKEQIRKRKIKNDRV